VYKEKNEVERYLGDNCENPNNFKLDILGWWRCSVIKYKILFKMRQYVLAILISTVVSEVAFSTNCRILDSFQNFLSLSTIQTFVCCQN
jgi:hypothetical protein